MPLCDTAVRPAASSTGASARVADRSAGRLAAGLLAGLVVAGGSVALAGPAAAESRVSVTDDSGTAVTEVVAGSSVHVSGSGFQSVQGGAGGIYVTFGWVDDAAGGTWRPTQGGATGLDYLYAPDIEGAENKGFQRYVAFPGSSTEAAANGGVIAADGTWATELAIPAPQFDAVDRAGNPAAVDCAQVQCGFITVGAHGVKNANNETFTPVTFVDAVATTMEVAPEETADATDAATDAATSDAADGPTTDAEVTEEITPISAPVEVEEDGSAQRKFILSMAGGFLMIALLVYFGVRRARARRAAETAETATTAEVAADAAGTATSPTDTTASPTDPTTEPDATTASPDEDTTSR